MGRIAAVLLVVAIGIFVIVAATTSFPVVAVITTTTIIQLAEAQRFSESGSDTGPAPDAPFVVSGDNIYIAWWTNNTENGNEEVMFRASNDGGATFSDSINLSNSSDADSLRVEVAAEGADVVVSWWETTTTNQTNQTSDIPVARVSNDAGETFGPMIMLGMNGTIDSAAEEVIATEAGEGEEG